MAKTERQLARHPRLALSQQRKKESESVPSSYLRQQVSYGWG